MFALDSSKSLIFKTWKLIWNLCQDLMVEVLSLDEVLGLAKLKLTKWRKIVDKKTQKMLIGPRQVNSWQKVL